jgi:predicted AAA+ superfamily ATPase
MEKVAQSLAGRTLVSKLLPFSRREIVNAAPPLLPIARNNTKEVIQKSKRKKREASLEEYMWTGGYPRIYDKHLNPYQWLGQYFQTYVERDVRALIQVNQLDLFDRFVRLCAGRVGQLLNLSSLANDCGISQPTARAWLGVLQASFIAFTLQPHFRNFNKRIIKSPKLYFYDTGLLCYLLKISDPKMLEEHPLRGYIFENWIIVENAKSYYHQGKEPPFYFWRDTKGHEIDLVEDLGIELYPTEIKASSTFHPHFLKNIEYWEALQKINGRNPRRGDCIYTGDETFPFKHYFVLGWKYI